MLRGVFGVYLTLTLTRGKENQAAEIPRRVGFWHLLANSNVFLDLRTPLKITEQADMKNRNVFWFNK